MCDCIKILLQNSGYDCELSFENMNDDRLCELENYVQKNLRNIVTELKCSHSEIYSNISKKDFHFLPGHCTEPQGTITFSMDFVCRSQKAV